MLSVAAEKFLFDFLISASFSQYLTQFKQNSYWCNQKQKEIVQFGMHNSTLLYITSMLHYLFHVLVMFVSCYSNNTAIYSC